MHPFSDTPGEGPIVHPFPGQGDFTLSTLSQRLAAVPVLRDAVGDVFAQADPIAAEFDLSPIGPRLLSQVAPSTGALAADKPGTLQLALFGVCLAVHRVLTEIGLTADRILAVSFGEIPALVAAGACAVEDGARLACLLGRLLTRKSGGLTLLHTDDRRTREMLHSTTSSHGSLAVACIIDDHETIVSGPIDALAHVESLADSAGITAQRLRLPFPAHHPTLWREAGEFAHFARSLQLQPPHTPLFSAVAGHAYSSSTDLAKALGACVVRPAILPPVMRQAADGARAVFEVGTGDSLTRSVRRSIPELAAYAPITDPEFTWKHTAELDFSDLSRTLAANSLRDLSPTLAADTSAHQKLRLLAAQLPPAVQVYRDARLLASTSELVALADPALYQTFLSHYILCVGSVADLGTEAADPKQDLAHAHAKGSFMVTEIGEASSHLGIRTRAVYDAGSHQFLLHTPDARAAKFSSVAVTGLPQKAVVLARLIVGGQNHGVFSFLTDITDETGAPAPGVRLSAPIAIDAVPLPYAIVEFDGARVPFDSWLSDGARLTNSDDSDSAYLHDPLPHPDARLQRTLNCGQALWATLPSALAGMSCRSAVIAWRYNSRRLSHGRLAPDSPVLTYRTQQHAIIGGLAEAFALRCTADSALALREVARTRGPDQHQSQGSMAFAPWAAVDRSLALYKAYATQATGDLIDRLQHRCGVSGFFALNRMSGYHGFARAFDNAGGDNTLIYLDAGRALAQSPDDSPAHPSDVVDPLSPQWWPTIVATLERQLAAHLRTQLSLRMADGAEGLKLWNPLLDQALQLGTVRAHHLAADAVSAALTRDIRPPLPSLTPAATSHLAALYGVLQARRLAGHLLAAEVLAPATVLRLPEVADELCDLLAPQLPDITDALDCGADFARTPMEAPDFATALKATLDRNSVILT